MFQYMKNDNRDAAVLKERQALLNSPIIIINIVIIISSGTTKPQPAAKPSPS